MKRAALIGSPVAHSVAPSLHHYLARLAGIEFEYSKLHVEPADLASTLPRLMHEGFSGCNVTLPYKQSVALLVDELDPAAAFTGAVNTVVFDQGRSRGYNTDWVGIAGALTRVGLPNATKGDKAVILGSGGAARAAIYALHQFGFKDIEVVYLDPPDAQTRGLMDEAIRFDIKLSGYTTVIDHLETAKVILDMTSAGMIGNDPSPFDLKRLQHTALDNVFVLDAVFNPVQTPFLQAAAAQGAVTVDGLWMMMYQAFPTFKLWTGYEAELSGTGLYELHDLLADAVAAQ